MVARMAKTLIWASLIFADMYLCWPPDTLYVGIYTDDIRETDYYKAGKIPEEDRMALTLGIHGGKEPLRFRLGANREPHSNNTEVGVLNFQILRSNITVLRIPSKLFGRRSFATGNKVKFSASLETLARAQKIEWKIDYPLARGFSN